MNACSITGEAIVQRIQRLEDPLMARDQIRLRWLKTDSEIHVAQELLSDADDDGLAFLTATYELGEPCPHQQGVVHARLRETL